MLPAHPAQPSTFPRLTYLLARPLFPMRPQLLTRREALLSAARSCRFSSAGTHPLEGSYEVGPVQELRGHKT
jgi:hypothetical protein